MARPKHNNSAQRRAHLARVARLLLKQRSRKEIAAIVGVAPSQVTYDAKQLERLWLEDAKRDIGVVKARELARIDLLEREAWGEWERSKQSSKTVTDVGIEAGASTGTRQTVRTQPRLGDPRYLAIVEWCIDLRLRLYGIDAATPFNTSVAMNMGGKINETNNAGILIDPAKFEQRMSQLSPATRTAYIDEYIRLSRLTREFLTRVLGVPTGTIIEGEVVEVASLSFMGGEDYNQTQSTDDDSYNSYGRYDERDEPEPAEDTTHELPDETTY
jgi:hypothetical protein